MSYAVKEIFYSLQGEGFHSGRPAIFCRFSQCNLWTGREQDRANAICTFCDTDFIGTDGQNGGRFRSANDLCQRLLTFWPENSAAKPFVVLTGGEPLLQVDDELITALHRYQFEIAVETNGTKKAPAGIDWLCVSPKAGAPLIQDTGHELKLVYPQSALMPESLQHLSFQYFFLQPMETADPKQNQHNIEKTLQFCLQHPQWRLSLQTHKLLGID